MEETFEEPGVAFVHHLPSHNTRLLDSLYRQWIDCKYCDLLLLVQGEPILVHACVVSAFSPTLAEILLYRSCEKDVGTGSVKSNEHSNLDDEEHESFPPSLQKPKGAEKTVALSFSLEVVQCVLSAFYTGVLRPKEEFLGELLEAAEWLCATDLVSAIKEHALELTSGLIELSIGQSTTAKLQVENGVCHKSSKFTREDEERPLEFAEKRTENNKVKTSSPEQGIRSRTFIGSIGDNEVSLDSLLDLKNDDSCVIHLQEDANLKEGLEKSKIVCDPLDKGIIKTCGETGVRNKQYGSRNSYSDPKVMVARLKKELTELKQKCQKTKRKPTGSALQPTKAAKPKSSKENERKVPNDATSTCKGKRPKRKKEQAIAVTTNDVNLIEKVEDNDPMKQELDFLVGSTNHVKCRQCHEKFTNIDIYDDHIKNHPVFICNECGTSFMRKFSLTRHMRYDHGASHLVCKLCGIEEGENEKTKTFTAKSEAELRRHFLEIHGKKNPFICSQDGCPFSASKYSWLVHHKQIHNKEKGFVCDKCGQGFAQHEGLMSHQRSCYHLQQYLCDLCGQSFNQPQSMRSHRRVVHFGEKPFKCSVCSNSFSNHGNLRRHMRIHDNSFPYACAVCSQKYRHSNSLKAHMVTKHPGLPPEQYQLPNPQPRNKLGGKSYKPRGARKSLKASEYLLRTEGQAQVTSNNFKGDNGQKFKANDLRAQESSIDQAQQSAHYHSSYQPLEEHHLRALNQDSVSLSVDSSGSASGQTEFEVSSANNIDIAIDHQMGLSALQVKTAVSQGQGEIMAITTKGGHSQSTDSLQVYTAFLEKQTALYRVQHNADLRSHQGNVTTATHPLDSHLLNPQNYTNSPKPGLSNHHLLTDQQNHYHHDHQSNDLSVYSGTETSVTAEIGLPTQSQSATTILTFPICTSGYQQNEEPFHVFKNGAVVGSELLQGEGGQSSNQKILQGHGLAQFCQSQEDTANLSKACGNDNIRHSRRTADTNGTSRKTGQLSFQPSFSPQGARTMSYQF